MEEARIGPVYLCVSVCARVRAGVGCFSVLAFRAYLKILVSLLCYYSFGWIPDVAIPWYLPWTR